MGFISDQPAWLFYGVGAIIAVIGIAMFFLDRDPALLFESPVFTLFMIIVGGGVAYLGWQGRSGTGSNRGTNEGY